MYIIKNRPVLLIIYIKKGSLIVLCEQQLSKRFCLLFKQRTKYIKFNLIKTSNFTRIQAKTEHIVEYVLK